MGVGVSRRVTSYGFRPEKEGTPDLVLMPVGIFVVPLATTGFALVWLGLATVYLVGDLLYVGFVFAGLSVVLYVGAIVAYGLKAFRHFSAVRDEWNHPFKVNIFGVIPLTLLNLTAIASFIDITLATVLFYIATPVQLLLTFMAAARWLSVARGLNDINPSYFIPIVGLAAIPVAAVPVGKDLFCLFVFDLIAKRQYRARLLDSGCCHGVLDPHVCAAVFAHLLCGSVAACCAANVVPVSGASLFADHRIHYAHSALPDPATSCS